MADWSQLPADLLEQIAGELTVRIDVVRFRSVCSSWRSSVPHPHPPSFPIRIPIGSTAGLCSRGSFHLDKRLIFNLTSPNHHGCGWIVKIQHNDVSHASHLLNPLSDSRIHPLPCNFPKKLDLTHVRISQLGQEYLLRFADQPPYAFAGDVYREKVVLNDAHNLLMTIHVSGKLVLFNFQTNVWSVVPDMSSPYEDVIFYNGDFCAVDASGRAVVVDSMLKVTEVASPIVHGDKKYLLELDGDLLLVDKYFSFGSDDFSPYPLEFFDADVDMVEMLNDVYNPDHLNYQVYVPNDDTYAIDTTAHFKVYKLDPTEKSWVEMKSLGDKIILLGENSSFSVSASHFNGNDGNCIYFTDGCFQSDQAEDGSFKGHCIGVFDMEDASIGPLASYPDHSQLFWPPPIWLTQPSS